MSHLNLPERIHEKNNEPKLEAPDWYEGLIKKYHRNSPLVVVSFGRLSTLEFVCSKDSRFEANPTTTIGIQVEKTRR